MGKGADSIDNYNGLSDKEKSVYDFSVSFRDEKGRMPSLREISRGLGLKSVSGVHSVVKSLGSRGIAVTPHQNDLPNSEDSIFAPITHSERAMIRAFFEQGFFHKKENHGVDANLYPKKKNAESILSETELSACILLDKAGIIHLRRPGSISREGDSWIDPNDGNISIASDLIFVKVKERSAANTIMKAFYDDRDMEEYKKYHHLSQRFSIRVKERVS